MSPFEKTNATKLKSKTDAKLSEMFGGRNVLKEFLLRPRKDLEERKVPPGVPRVEDEEDKSKKQALYVHDAFKTTEEEIENGRDVMEWIENGFQYSYN